MQQTANCKRQTANSKQQTANGFIEFKSKAAAVIARLTSTMDVFPSRQASL
jgi:hypothetical protein